MQEPGIKELLDRLLKGTITPGEKEALAEWIARSEDHELDWPLAAAWKTFETSEAIPAGKADELLRGILERGGVGEEDPAGLGVVGGEDVPGAGITAGMEAIAGTQTYAEENFRRPLYVRLRRYRLAAAVLLVLAGAGALYLLRGGVSGEKPGNVAAARKDVMAPSASNAVITLANGQRIMLDSVGSGSLVQQGGTDLVKLGDGEIVYRREDGAGDASGSGAGKPGETRAGGPGSGSQAGTDNTRGGLQWNTITVPEGSRIASLTLSDGTRVWLNSGSSMTYPVAFGGKERMVSVNGEVYFEVARDHRHPFVVAKGDLRVNVLGTHFNINAYDDESNIRVTLLEGSIEVNKGVARKMVAPGQMAVMGANRGAGADRGMGADGRMGADNGIGIEKDADLDRVMAWRNGRFDFGNADIQSIMRELSRWYGLEVEYREPVSEKFHLETSRDINVSDVFRILETTGGVHFQTEGKKIIIMR